jgi:hypothetical protein
MATARSIIAIALLCAGGGVMTDSSAFPSAEDLTDLGPSAGGDLCR